MVSPGFIEKSPSAFSVCNIKNKDFNKQTFARLMQIFGVDPQACIFVCSPMKKLPEICVAGSEIPAVNTLTCELLLYI